MLSQNYRNLLTRNNLFFDLIKFSTNSSSLFNCNKASSSIKAKNKSSSIKPLRPLKISNFKESVIKLKKNSSLIKGYLFTKFDFDLLHHSTVINSKVYFSHVINQAKMTAFYFRSIFNDKKTLNELGFFDLWKLTFTEMMTIFEAIGSSLSITFDDVNYTQVNALQIAFFKKMLYYHYYC